MSRYRSFCWTCLQKRFNNSATSLSKHLRRSSAQPTLQRVARRVLHLVCLLLLVNMQIIWTPAPQPLHTFWRPLKLLWHILIHDPLRAHSLRCWLSFVRCHWCAFHVTLSLPVWLGPHRHRPDDVTKTQLHRTYRGIAQVLWFISTSCQEVLINPVKR